MDVQSIFVVSHYVLKNIPKIFTTVTTFLQMNVSVKGVLCEVYFGVN